MATITARVKTATALCEMGQCGGEVTLTTDGVRGIAQCAPESGSFFYAESDLIEVHPDGTIVVSCAAEGHMSTCNGAATFEPADLAVAPVDTAPGAGEGLVAMEVAA